MLDTATFELQEAVTNILGPLGLSREKRERLCTAYAEPWRTYHNATHIVTMLKNLERLHLPETGRVHLLDLMILYHDVWYKVGKDHGTNEVRSAAWMLQDMREILSPEDSNYVFEGIWATADHRFDKVASYHRELVAILLDLDLCGLGQDQEEFAKDTERIWHEYEPIATREEYDRGRKAWAQGFLERSQIYHTPYFQRFESRARENLEVLVRGQ